MGRLYTIALHMTERFLLEATLLSSALNQLMFWNGEVAEWLKASDCKSDHYVYVGSNPTLSTTDRYIKSAGVV